MLSAFGQGTLLQRPQIFRRNANVDAAIFGKGGCGTLCYDASIACPVLDWLLGASLKCLENILLFCNQVCSSDSLTYCLEALRLAELFSGTLCAPTQLTAPGTHNLRSELQKSSVPDNRPGSDVRGYPSHRPPQYETPHPRMFPPLALQPLVLFRIPCIELHGRSLPECVPYVLRRLAVLEPAAQRRSFFPSSA